MNRLAKDTGAPSGAPAPDTDTLTGGRRGRRPRPRSELNTKMVRVPQEALALAKELLPCTQCYNLGDLFSESVIAAAERLDTSGLPAPRRLLLQAAIARARGAVQDPDRARQVRRPDG